MRKANGFTLIEIAIVVVVLGILAAVVFMPMLGNRRAVTSNTASLNCGRAIQNTQALYSSRSGSFATNMEQLANTNIALLDGCDWSNPNSDYTVTGDDSADNNGFAFTVTYANGDTTYRVTPGAITPINDE